MSPDHIVVFGGLPKAFDSKQVVLRRLLQQNQKVGELQDSPNYAQTTKAFLLPKVFYSLPKVLPMSDVQPASPLCSSVFCLCSVYLSSCQHYTQHLIQDILNEYFCLTNQKRQKPFCETQGSQARKPDRPFLFYAPTAIGSNTARSAASNFSNPSLSSASDMRMGGNRRMTLL